MCQSSKDGPGSPGTDHQGLPLQRQTCVYAAVQAVCQTPLGVLLPGLVPLDGDGQVLPGKSAAKAVRQVSGLASTTYEEKLLELGLPTLEERQHQADMCMVHKILHGKCPASQVRRRPKCDRITPSHPLSWPCVSDLLLFKGESWLRAETLDDSTPQ